MSPTPVRPLNLLRLLTCIIGLALLSACVPAPPMLVRVPPTPTTAPSTAPAPAQVALRPGSGLSERPAAAIFTEISPSVAFVKTPSGTGSGALIEHGYLLTNAHVVWPYTTVRVVFPNGAEFPEAPVVAWDLMADLALVGPLETDISPLKLVDGSDLEIGSRVYLIGYPAEVETYPQPSITNGILSRLRTWDGLDYTFFQVDATTVGGQSGGIMVTHGGDVVGISTFYYSGFGLAGSVADALPRLNALLGNASDAVLETRPFPLADGATVVTGTLKNATTNQVYVLNAPSKAEVELSIEGIGRPQVAVSSGRWGGVASSTPTSPESKVSTASFTVDTETPYFVRVAQPSPNEHTYVLTSTHPLVRYDDPDDMQQLVIGEMVVGSIDEPRDSDIFELALEEGQVVTIVVDALKIDPMVTLHYESDSLRETAYDNDSGGGIFDQSARLVYRAPASDIYQVGVGSSGFGQVGGYFIRVDEAPQDVEVKAPQTSIKLASRVYGGMAWYESEKYDLAVLYPIEWGDSPGGCGAGSTACKVTPKAALVVVEESMELLPRRQRNQEGYVDLLLSILEAQPGVKLLASEPMTTVQKLDALKLTYSAGAGRAIADRLVFVDEETQTAFNVTILMESDLYDMSQSLRDFIFDSFRYWNMENITDTAAFQLDEAMQLNLTQQYTQAIAAYTKAIELDPTLDLAYLRRGSSYYEVHEDELALADLQHAVALAPYNADRQSAYATLLWALGRPENALAVIEQAINLEPERYEHYKLRAHVHNLLGDFAAAQADLDEVSDLTYGELPIDAKDTRAYLYLQMGDDKAALEDYITLLDKDVSWPYVLLGAGVAAMRTGEEAQGRAWLEQGRSKLDEEIEKDRIRRLDPQLLQLLAWADELYPEAAVAP